MDQEQVIKTKKIRIFGMVQGVGFRPLVFRLAVKYGINGFVRNTGGIVEITAQAPERRISEFLLELKENGSEVYEIVNLEVQEIGSDEFREFQILDSGEDLEVSIIPPDLPVCRTCQKELETGSDRRYQNPFISCTACGPRYTILEALPYDRHTTSMSNFPMCKECTKEYTDIRSRRFHAQTISCNDCGPYLILNQLKDKAALEEAVTIIKNGGILAVKGIGGFHFVCSPFLEETVLNLRRLKGREEKPFAVMFADIDSAAEYCMISKEERDLLLSKARPIVLLYRKNKPMAEAVNRGEIYWGVFLPYTPLQILLTKNCGPLIMTSGNQSGRPIIKDEDKIQNIHSPYLSGVLYNKRKIVRSVDDSVAKIIDQKPQLIRRSRGYVPYPIYISGGKKDTEIFAAGGDLKAAFCFCRKGSAVVSQYFGDLEEVSVMEEYKSSCRDLARLFHMDPKLVVCDLHPNYHSALFANTLGLPVLKVQHHHAHIASVMAEQDLNGPVIGVAFDGTGYGCDGNIWGGEFLVCGGAEFNRAAHLMYTSILGGDRSMRDGKKTAGCFLIEAGLSQEIRDDRLELMKAALDYKVNTVLTSSMGRLFDAVSSILGICQENRYEGICAAMLEKEAVMAEKNHIKPERLFFQIAIKNKKIEIDPQPIIRDLIQFRKTVSAASLALGFHYAVSDMVLQVCSIIREEQGIYTVALSGGVFQNTLLTNRTLNLLRKNGFYVYINQAVPPNDGSISLGQTYIGLMS